MHIVQMYLYLYVTVVYIDAKCNWYKSHKGSHTYKHMSQQQSRHSNTQSERGRYGILLYTLYLSCLIFVQALLWMLEPVKLR